jgi:hypothetical protein
LEHRSGPLSEHSHNWQPNVMSKTVRYVGQIRSRPRRVQTFGRLGGLHPNHARALGITGLNVRDRQQRKVELPSAGVVTTVHFQRPLGESAREVTTSKGREAVAKLRGKIRLVEVADPMRVARSVGPVEKAFCAIERSRRGRLVTPDRVALRFQHRRLGLNGRHASTHGRTTGRSRKVDSLGRRTKICRLMAHRGKDFGAECTIASSRGQP